MTEQKRRKSLRVAIVIEWGNALIANPSRPKKMLAQSRKLSSGEVTGIPKIKKDFLAELTPPLEIVILYDSANVTEQQLKAFVREVFENDEKFIATKLIPAAGMDYYDVKNYGAEQTESDILIFLDSDVIPEDDWLANSLGEFVDPGIEVVFGNTYIEPYNVYAKAFALGWIFEPRYPDGELREIRRFHANNLAIRRKTFLKHKFPKFKDSMHASCGQLADDLMAAGVTIYQNPKARASHPPPNGLGHFVTRALAEGRDNLITSQIKALDANELRQIPINKRTFQNGLQRLAAIAKNRETANLSAHDVPLAVGIMLVYYALYLCGNIVERLFPKFARERLAS